MAKSHKTCMEQAEIIDTFGTYQGSLDILCRKPITSGKVKLSKSSSLLSKREVVISFKLTCLKASTFIEVYSSMVEGVASPLIGPVGLGV